MPVFKGNKSFYDYEVSDILSHNIRNFLEYGLIETGAYTTITFNSSTSGYTNLKRVNDDRYGKNRVFEGLGPGWVWESGVSVIPNIQAPFQVSGVYITNTFFPISTSGQYSYIVDYRNGRVIFNNDLPIGSGVKCQYTMRDVGTYLTDGRQWKTIIEKYDEKFADLETFSPSGMASILKEHRVWLPSVFIEVSDRTNHGLQLGGGDLAVCSIKYHIFAERAFDNKRLCDIINNQFEKVLSLYDVNIAPPTYNFNGSLGSGVKTYPQLSDRNGQYFWTFAHIEDSAGGPRPNSLDIYRGEILQSVSVARYNVTY